VREPLPLSDAERAEHDHWAQLYGTFDALDVEGVRAFFSGFDRPWWLVGGYALEAFTGAEREHDDIDVSMLACDVPALREFVGDRWHLWTVHDGALRPMSEEYPDLPSPESQIWVRRNAGSPWVIDLPLTPDVAGRWRNKKLPDHVAPVDEVTWVTSDGVRMLNPEIVLMYKARLDRTKDRRDLARAWPLLREEQRVWLTETIETLFPGHAWLELAPALGR
jgi:hypothetical protein